MARFGTKNTVAEHDDSVLGSPYEADALHEDTSVTDEQAWDDSPTNAAATISEVPEVPAHDAEATGAKTRRGRPKLGDLPELTADALGEAEDVPEAEWASTPLDETRIIERSATQLAIDAAVKSVHDAWLVNKPPARSAPRKRYTVKPEMAATTRAMLTRAGAFHKVRVIATTTHDQNGMAVIVFSAIDRPPSVKKSDKK